MFLVPTQVQTVRVKIMTQLIQLLQSSLWNWHRSFQTWICM